MLYTTIVKSNYSYIICRSYGENMSKFTAVINAVNGDKKDLFLNKTMKELLFE